MNFLFAFYTFLFCVLSIIIFLITYFIIYIAYIVLFLPSNFEFKFLKYIGDLIRPLFSGISRHFPVEFLNRHSIKPNRKYLYVFIPHGLVTLSQIVHILDPQSPLKSLAIYNAAHSFVFKIPVLREIALMLGVIPVDKSYLLHYFKESSISITVGGMREVSYALDNQEDDKLFIKKRKGFVKIAKDADAEIVPIYCWNEQQIITYKQSDFLDNLSDILSKIFGRTFEINFLQFLLPDRLTKIGNALFGKISAVKLFVGTPIDISKYSIDEAHEIYIEKITELFNYAAKAENSSKKLIIE